MIGNEKAQLCTGGGDELCIENQRYLRQIDASEGKEAEEKGTNLLARVISPARTKNAPNPPLRFAEGRGLPIYCERDKPATTKRKTKLTCPGSIDSWFCFYILYRTQDQGKGGFR